jgi:hypothetical protein
VATDLRDLISGLGSAKKAMDAAAGAQRDFAAETRRMIGVLDGLGTQFGALSGAANPFAKALEGVNAKLGETSKASNLAATSMSGQASAFDALALGQSKVLQGLTGYNTGLKASGTAARLHGDEVKKLGGAVSGAFSAIASGGNPMKALLEGAPAVVEVLESAATRGVGLKGILASVATELGTIGGVATGPFGMVAQVVAQAAIATYDYAKSQETLAQVAATAGRATGLTGEGLSALAERAAAAGNVSIASAESMVQAYIRLGVMSAPVLQKAIELTDDYARATGQDATVAMNDLGRILANPAQGMNELSAKIGGVDGNTSDLILKMVRHNDLAGAQAEILKVVTKQTNAQAGSVLNLGQAFRSASDGMANFSRSAGKKIFNFFNPSEEDVANTFGGFGSTLTDRVAVQKRAAAEKVKAGKRADQSLQVAGLIRQLTPEVEELDALQTQKRQITDGLDSNLAIDRKRADAAVRVLNRRIGGLYKASANVGEETSSPSVIRPARAAAPTVNVDQVLEEASKAEVTARRALTKNIFDLADFRRQEIDQELKSQKDRLAKQHLDPGTTQKIEELYETTATAKKKAVDQDLAAQLVEREIAQRTQLAAFAERATTAQAAIADGAEAATQIEAKAFAARQKTELDTLAKRTAIQVATGEIDEFTRQDQLASLRGAQVAEAELAQRQRQARQTAEMYAASQQGLTNQISLLSSQADLAKTTAARRSIELRMLPLQQESERLKLQEIIATKGAGSAEGKNAQSQLNVLEQVQKAKLKSAFTFDDAFGDASGALKGMAQAFKGQDWQAAVKGLQSTFDGLKLAFGPDGSLQTKIGAIAGLANGLGSMIGGKAGAAFSGAGSGAAAGFQIGGPWGAAIGAVLGGAAGLLGASNAKAQAKIDSLIKAQQDLQAKQKESSGAIEKSLGLAAQYQNMDLDYSNAILASLRSIDSKIGAVAASIVRSIASGGLMGESGLGLGTTATKGDLGAGLAAGGLVGGALGGATSFLMSGFGGVLALGPIGLVAGAVGALVGALTKTRTTTEILDQGLQFTAASFGDIAKSGVTGSQYADLLTTKKTLFVGIGLSTKVSTSTVTSALDPTLLAQISGTIALLGEGVVTAAKTFGDDAGAAAAAALQSVSIDLGKLSLKGLKPEEIEIAVNALFNNVADDLAKAGLPGLQALAKAGEGSFEALTRLATEYKTVDAALAAVGMDFKSGGVGSLGARKDLLDRFGGLDAFTSQTAFFGEHFLTAEDRLKPLKATVASGLAAIGQPADLSREGFKALAQSQNLSTKEGAELYAALMALAPAFDKVATAAESAQKAIADKKSSIQDQIDALVLSPAELLAKSRKAEMKAVLELDKALGPFLETLWKAQDAAEAAKLATEQSGMRADLMEAQGRSEEAKALRRSLALAAIEDPVQKVLQQQIWAAQDAAEKVAAARDVLTQAYQREHDAIQATKDKFKELSTSLRAFSASLSGTIAGADLATRYRMARQTFQSTASLARLGDADAMGRLQADGEAFTAASRDYVSTSQDYLRDVGLVRSAVDEAADTADRQVSIAQRQLDALDESVKGLIQINASVVSVEQAILNLRGALAAANAAGVVSVGGSSLGLSGNGTSGGGSGSGGVDLKRTLDGKYYYDSMLGFLAYTEAQHDPQYYPGGLIPALTPGTESYSIYQTYLARDKDKSPYLNYATGGSFEVGGSGPPDSKLFNLALSPGEAVNVQRADQKNDKSLINELRALRQELADLRATSARIATSNDKMERTLTNVTEGGRAMQTQAAA